MKWEELISKLIISDNRYTLSSGDLTPEVDSWLAKYFPSGNLVIDNATKTEESDKVTIAGISSVCNVENAEVSAEFSLDDKENVCVILTVTLDPKNWNFLQSFPDMPAGPINPVLNIDYSECCLYLSNQYVEQYRKICLYEGINFYGVISGSPLMDLVEHTWNIYPILYGHINLDDTAVLDPLEWGDYPFRHEDPSKPVPGFVFTVEIEDYTSFSICDAVSFSGIGLKMYCPPSAKFYEKNTTYMICNAFHSTIAIPKLNISDECWVQYDPNAAAFALSMDFENVSLQNLVDIAFLYGNQDAQSMLPEALRTTQLGKLSLTGLETGFDLSGGTPQIQFFALSIGMPDAWWNIVDEQYRIGNLGGRFVYRPDGDDNDRFEITVTGEVDIKDCHLAVRATKSNGFAVCVDTLNGLSIPFSKFKEKGFPFLPDCNDLVIDRIRGEIGFSDHIEVLAQMASGANAWVIPVGRTELKLSDISLFFKYDLAKGVEANDQKYSGFFSGTIALSDKLRLSATCGIPGGVSILMFLPDFSLADFIGLFCDDSFTLPAGLNLKLTRSMVLFEKDQDRYLLRLATMVNDCGFMMFCLRKNGEKTGFVFGVNIDGNKLGNLFGLADLTAFDDFFHLEKLVFIASTMEDKSFTFPGTEEFQVDIFKQSGINQTGNNGVQEGLSFMAEWRIDTTNDQQKLLQDWLKLQATMAVALQLGKDEYRLAARCSADICDHQVDVEFGGVLSEGSVALYGKGSFDITILETVQKATLEFGFNAGGVYGAVTLQGDDIDFKWFKLRDLAFLLGVDWEGIPSIGLAGSITLGERFNSSIAVLFDSTEPEKSMVAGSISDLSLDDIFGLFLPDDCASKRAAAQSIGDIHKVLKMFSLTGTQSFELSTDLIQAFDKADMKKISTAFKEHNVTIPSSISQTRYTIGTPGSSWFITDTTDNLKHYEIIKTTNKETKEEVLKVSLEAQVHAVPQTTYIGELRFDQGLRLCGRLQMNKFFVDGIVDVKDDGLLVNAKMSKIDICNGLLCIAGVNETKTGPSDEGPELVIDTYGEPYAHVDAYMTFLGMSNVWTGIVNEKGFSADVKIKGVCTELDIYSTLVSKESFDGTMSLTIQPLLLEALTSAAGKVFGDLDLTTGASGSVTLSVYPPEVKFYCSINLEILGVKIPITNVDLDLNIRSVKDFEDAIVKILKESIVAKLVKDSLLYAKLVIKGMIRITEKLVTVLVRLYEIGVEEALRIIEEATEYIEQNCAVTKATEKM